MPAALSQSKIRRAGVEDAEGIARVYIESAEHHTALDAERYRVPELEAVIARYRHRAGDDSITLVVEIDGQIAGFVDAHIWRSADLMLRHRVYLYVAEIAVLQRFRSAGAGQRLLAAAEEWGRERGAVYSYLDYSSENVRVAAFYERMGYRTASFTMMKRLSET